MTKITQLFALTLSLGSFTAPVFAHDVDMRASVSDRVIAHRANTRMSPYDRNHDGHVAPYEVRRVKHEQERQRQRQQELARRQQAAARARAHEQELALARVRVQEQELALARARAHEQELALARARARSREQRVEIARVTVRDDHHFTAPSAYRR